MEMNSLGKVVVATLDNNESHLVTVKICNNNEIDVDEIYQKSCKEIGLQQSSQLHFSLFQGCKRPTRRYKPGERIPMQYVKDLSFQRWCFDPKVENNKLLKDSAATHLLYIEAAEGITSGRLKPTSEEQHKLEEFLDPSFVLENQYVTTCQTIPRYWSHQFTNCIVTESFQTDSVCLPKDTEITVYIGRTGLDIETCNNSFTSPWQHLKSWSRDKDSRSRISFELLSSLHDLQVLHISTDQSELMLSMVMEIIKVLQSEDASAPAFLTSMIKTKEDVMTHWDNVLYDPNT